MQEGVDSNPQTTEAQSDTLRSRSSNSQVRKATCCTCVLQPLEARSPPPRPLRLASCWAMTHFVDHCDLLLSLSPEGHSWHLVTASPECHSVLLVSLQVWTSSSPKAPSAANAGLKQWRAWALISGRALAEHVRNWGWAPEPQKVIGWLINWQKCAADLGIFFFIVVCLRQCLTV